MQEKKTKVSNSRIHLHALELHDDAFHFRNCYLFIEWRQLHDQPKEQRGIIDSLKKGNRQ